MSVAENRLNARFRQTAQRRREQLAFAFLDHRLQARTYSFGELFDIVDQLAARLRPHHLSRAAPLGILLRSQESQVLHYLAALAAGLVPAILTPPNRKLNRQYYAQTMAVVLDRCQFTGVITDQEGLVHHAPAFAPNSLEPLAPRSHEDALSDPDSPPLSASFLQFSSGTTGIKRGVLITDDAVLAQLDSYARAIDLSDQDRIVSWLPLYHDMGFIACLNMPLAAGVPCIMLDPIDWVSHPALFLKAVSQYRATLAWNPNFAYAFMAQRVADKDLDGIDLSSLRGLVNCSEPVTHESQRLFEERFARCGLAEHVFWGCYAMAETTFALTHGTSRDANYLDVQGPSGEVAPRPGPVVSVGQMLPHVEMAIVSSEGTEVPDRHIGEICVKSPFNFSGYFRDADSTRHAVRGDWYVTGDLGYRVGPDLFIVGRKKDVLIVGGVNVFPQDIEELVGRLPGIRPGRVAAFSVFDPLVQTEHVIVLAESDLPEIEARRTALTMRQLILASFQLANFEVHLLPPEWMVKSSSGKMARGASKQKWLAHRAASHPPPS